PVTSAARLFVDGDLEQPLRVPEMEDLRRGTDPDPSDALPSVRECFGETMAPRPGVVAKKVVDRRARSLDRLVRRPVASSALLVRVLVDLTFDELRNFLKRKRGQIDCLHGAFGCSTPLFPRQTLLPVRYYDGSECPSSFGRRRRRSPRPPLRRSQRASPPRRPRRRPPRKRPRRRLPRNARPSTSPRRFIVGSSKQA